MTDFSNWTIDQEYDEGVDFILGHRGVSIVLVRNGTPIAAQTMFVGPMNTPRETSAEQGQSAKQEYIIIGEADLNIRRGDRFSYQPVNANQLNYEVTSVDKSLHGQVQARAVQVN